MTANNNLPPEMTVDEALQFAEEQTMGTTFYGGKRDSTVVLWLLANEVRQLRKLVLTTDN